MGGKVKRSRRPGVTCVSAKHQITLPVAAMREAGLHVGDELLIRADGDGRLVVVREESRIDRWAGAIPGLGSAAELDELRNEWER
ncbi:MAG: AbrB/MazE/SpoVT family DNA-binding domain-containing protein [Stackebrandtia sp.]